MKLTKNIIKTTFIVVLMLSCYFTTLKAQQVIQDNEPPTPPDNLSVHTGIHKNIIWLKWEPSKDNVWVKGYKIFRNDTYIAATRSPIFIDRNVEKLVLYKYKVVAFDEKGNSSESDTVEVELQDLTPPSVPNNIKVDNLTHNSIKLSWDASEDNIGMKGYIIYRNGKEINKVITNTFEDTNLLPGRIYCYRIKAYDIFNNISGASKILMIKTLEVGTDVPQAIVLSANILSDTSIELEWSQLQANEGIKEYIVYRNQEEVTRTNSFSYIDTSLNPKTNYTYKIKCVNLSGDSINSSNTITLCTYSTGEPSSDYQQAIELTNEQFGYIDFEGDTDWFKVNALSKCRLNVELDGINSNITASLEILDSEFNLLQSSAVEDGMVKLSADIMQGCCYIKLKGLSGYSLDNSYRISVSFENFPSLSCTKAEGGIQLSWTENSNCTGYNVYRAIGDEQLYQRIAQVNENKYLDSNVENNTRYFYKVGYVNSNGNEIISDYLEINYLTETYVSGTINRDTVWDSWGSPYIVQGNITVPQGIYLKIKPGTVIKFSTGANMTVHGKVDAHGLAEYPIVFTSIYDPEYGGNGITAICGYWAGMTIKSTGQLNGEYIKVKYGGCENTQNLKVEGSLILLNSEVSNSYCSDIVIESSNNVIIQNSIIKAKGGGGLDYRIKVTNSNAGEITIKNNTITSDEDKSKYYGISISNNGAGTVTVQNNHILRHCYAIEVGNSGTGSIIVENNIIDYSLPDLYVRYAIGISKYQNGTLRIRNNNVKQNGQPLFINLSQINVPISAILEEISNNTFVGCKDSVGIDGTLTGDMTLPKSLYGFYNSYEIFDSLTIPNGITLKIEPGVIIKSGGRSNTEGSIVIHGKVDALGTAQNPVIFTSRHDPDYGGSGVSEYYHCWNGIRVGSTGVFCGDNVKIRYAGYYYNNIWEPRIVNGLNIQGNLMLINSSTYNSLGNTAIYIETNGIVTIRNNNLEAQSNLIKIYNKETTGTVVIENNVIKCGSKGIEIFNLNAGTITVRDNKLYDCSESIRICNGNTGLVAIENNVLDSSAVNYKKSGITIYGKCSDSLKINNNTLTDAGYPLYLELNNLTRPISEILEELSDNTFINCKETVGLEGTLSTNITLPKSRYSYFKAYEISRLTIPSGTVLIIEPGAVIKLQCIGNEEANITVNGKIQALGTTDNPIVFTSVCDPLYGGSGVTSYSDYWNGIKISSTGEFNGDNVKLRYAGYYYSNIWNMKKLYGLNVEGKLTLINSEVSNSGNTAIYFNSTTIPVILYNEFINNLSYGIYNVKASIITLDASYNYWGSIYGPSIYNEATGLWEGDGCKISTGIICNPWLGEEYRFEKHFGQEGINAALGSLSHTYTDMTLTLPNFEVNIGRTYNSRSDNGSVFGRGWTFSLEGSVIDHPNSSRLKVVKLPNGSSQTFNKNDDGTYTAMDSRNQLTRQTDGTFVLTTKDQYTYGFNINGYMVWMKDRNGNKVTLNIDENGKVLGLSDEAGRSYIITYTQQGLISSITDPIGRTVNYEYENGLLVRVIDPMGNIMRYGYDSEGYLSEIRDHNSNLLESVTYDHSPGNNQHKISQIIDAYGNTYKYSYDYLDSKTTITDSNGRRTIEWYDSSFYPIKTQDAEGKITTIEYYTTNGTNKYGEEKLITDRNGNKTQYLRDVSGNITRITNPDLSYKEFAYDEKNNLIKERDELGKYTFYVYDKNKINLIKKAQPLNGTDQYSVGCDESKFAVTNYSYYTEAEHVIKGLLKNVIDPENNTITYTYDTYGNIATIMDPEGNITMYKYNNVGLLEYEISPKGYRTDYTYDKNGNLEKKVLNNGETTRITYDNEDRKTKEVSPNLYDSARDDIASHIYSDDHGYRYTYYPYGKVHTITDPENNTTTYTYDLYGNVLTETKPNGAVFAYEYDVMNRLVKVYFKEDSEVQPILLEEYSYVILSDGKTQKTHTKYLNNTETATIIYTYDYAGRLVEKKNPNGTTILTGYNANGTISTTTDENGKSTYYRYDGLNRLTDKWTPIETSGSTVSYTYESIVYDKAGRKISEKISKNKVSFNSTPTTNLITTTYTYYKNGNVKSISDNIGLKKEFEYDSEGNLSKEIVYTDSVNKNVTEYINNHFGKCVEKKVHVKTGDIFDNDFDSTEDTILTTTYTYDKNGNLKTITTPDNITTVYEYDKLDRQVGISQPGRDEYDNSVSIIESVTYNFEGKPLTKTDANGNTTTYIYNQRGLLEKVINAKGGVTAYYYDRAGRKIAEVSPNSYDFLKTLSQMSRTEYVYDNMDRVKVVKNTYLDPVTNTWVDIVSKAYKYDKKGNVIKELDALGYEEGTGATMDEKINNGYGTEYAYNHMDKVVTVLDPVLKDRGYSYSIKYDYDGAGRKVSETNVKGVITTYYYDDAGNIVKVTVRKSASSPEQMVKARTYDYAGNITSETDGNGNTTAYEYNAFNKIRKVIYPGDSTIPSNVVIFQYDVLGNLKKQQDTFGTIDLYTYDNQGRVLSHTQQKSDGTEAITTSVKYDKNGNKRFEIDGNGVTKENTYNELNRLTTTSIVVTNVNDQQIKRTTTYAYDKNGNLLTETNWRNNTYTNIYDPLNRLIEKKDPYNKTIEKIEYNHNNLQVKSYNALGNITEYSYDKNNRLLSTKDPEGHITNQTYDNVGNIETKTDGNGNITKYTYNEFNKLISVTNAKNETTSYTYDLNGNLLTQMDGKGNVITFEYNVMNKPIRRIDQGGRTGTPGNYTYNSAKVESYTYYANGELKNKTDRKGNTFVYVYDSHSRKISQTVGKMTITYTYDNNGNQLTITDRTGTTTRSYDELNRIKTKTVPNIDTITYYYDIITNVDEGYVAETITDPKGNVTTKVYDKAGRLKEVRVGSETTTYNYYDDGTKQSVVYPDGSIEEYTYYKDNLLHTLINKKANGTIIDTYIYTYDGAHNQTLKTDSKGTTNYTYDKLNRLETVTEPNGKVTTYTFDKAGNRLTETVTHNGNTTITTYSYNEQNRLTGTTTKLNGVVVETKAYIYDNNGNVLTVTVTPYINGITRTSQTTTNTYDELDQLITTVTPDGTNIVNTYNGEGIRVSKSVNGVLTRYLYDSDKIILELDGLGNQKARNVYGANLTLRTVDGQTIYYFYNGHADVIALMDSAGQILATYYYDAFGNITESTGTVNNPYRYAGYQYDPETDTYYLMARMYDPVTARFLQEDTYRGDINDPLSLNLYTYCHNEPLMYVDPSGYFREGDVLSLNFKIISEDVKMLQKRLNELGYRGKDGKALKVDGIFGNNTLKAVNDYKNDHGLWNFKDHRGDYYGKVGITTWASLGLPVTKGGMDDLIKYYMDKGLLYTGSTQLVPAGYKKNTNDVTRGETNQVKAKRTEIETNEVKKSGSGSKSKSSTMQVSDDLISFIASYEGFASTPYRGQDAYNLTIGYGHVIQAGEDFSKGITQEQALELLKTEINEKYAKAVNKNTADIELTQQQFDALVSFTYNTGVNALTKSTLLKDIKSGKATPEKTKQDFLMWTKVYDAKNKTYFNSGGLWRRRIDEWELYTTGDYKRDYPKPPAGYR